MNKVEQVKELLKNADFLNEAENLEDAAGLKELFKENGVELTEEQVENLVIAAGQTEAAELDEEALEGVSGGASIKSYIKCFVKAFKKGWEWGNKFYEWEQSLYK